MCECIALPLQDEPTSHLDMQSIECLQACLQGYTGGLVLVTHDQHFCDSVAQQVRDNQLAAALQRCRPLMFV